MKIRNQLLAVVVQAILLALAVYFYDEEDQTSKALPCHPLGYTKIEYNKAVTSCGDTITIKTTHQYEKN